MGSPRRKEHYTGSDGQTRLPAIVLRLDPGRSLQGSDEGNEPRQQGSSGLLIIFHRVYLLLPRADNGLRVARADMKFSLPGEEVEAWQGSHRGT